MPRIKSKVRVLSQMLGVGQAHGVKNETRLKKALHEDITAVPDLTLRQKDHKEADPNTGIPKTRPVCEAKSTFNQRANGHLVAILKAAVDADPSTEAISTEDTISKLDSLNNKILQGEIKPRKLMTGSLDVESLYPSINTKVAGRDHKGQSRQKQN